MDKNTELQKMGNFINTNGNIEIDSKNFEKIMFMYKVAIKEIESKLDILKQEAKLFYDYDLIDHINTRIKTPESIIDKMENKELKYTYKYKPSKEITKSKSKELLQCAKIVDKLDSKMMLISN